MNAGGSQPCPMNRSSHDAATITGLCRSVSARDGSRASRQPLTFNVTLTLTRHGRVPHHKDQRMTDQTDLTDTVAVAGDRIRSIVERIERLEEEIKHLMDAKKAVFGE